MTGLTSSVKFNEIATKAQVSWRTASRLENIVTALDWEQFGFKHRLYCMAAKFTDDFLQTTKQIMGLFHYRDQWLGHSISHTMLINLHRLRFALPLGALPK
jgi:hypothetical protein